MHSPYDSVLFPHLGPAARAFFEDNDYLVLTRCRNFAAARGHDATFLSELQHSAVAVAAHATRFVRDRRAAAENLSGHVGAQHTKSSAVDPVTEVDQGAEQLIRELLFAQWPASEMLGEEDGRVLGPEAPEVEETHPSVVWVIDPIDGTVNFMYGLPAYAVSIAALVDGYPVATAVADVARERIFTARVGGGAFWLDIDAHIPGTQDGWQRIPLNEEDPPAATPAAAGVAAAQSLVATGFSYLAERRAAQAALLGELLPRVRDIRRIGSAAIDLCLVAQRRVDVFYEHGLGPWDHLGGALIAVETGVVVAVPPASVGSDQGKLVLAAKTGVFEFLAELIIGEGNGGILAPLQRR